MSHCFCTKGARRTGSHLGRSVVDPNKIFFSDPDPTLTLISDPDSVPDSNPACL